MNEAPPPDAASGTVAAAEPSIEKVTAPDGATGPETVAVNVTGEPKAGAEGSAARRFVVAAGSTVSGADESLGSSSASPE